MTNPTGFGPGFSKEIDALLRVYKERTPSGTPLIGWSEMRNSLRQAGLPLADDDKLLEVAGIELPDIEMEQGWGIEYDDDDDDSTEGVADEEDTE